MGREYWLELDDAEAYRALCPEIARWLRERPSCVLEVDPSDFLLKDPSSAGGWDHEVRVLLETERIHVVARVVGAVFARDVRELHAWLAARGRVIVVDADGDPVDPFEVFALLPERCLRGLERFVRAWRLDPSVDPYAGDTPLWLEGLVRWAVGDSTEPAWHDHSCDGVLDLRVAGDEQYIELTGIAVWLPVHNREPGRNPLHATLVMHGSKLEEVILRVGPKLPASRHEREELMRRGEWPLVARFPPRDRT